MHGLSDVGANNLKIPELNMTVAQYFKEKYNIELRYPRLPCVKVSAVFVDVCLSTFPLVLAELVCILQRARCLLFP